MKGEEAVVEKEYLLMMEVEKADVAEEDILLMIEAVEEDYLITIEVVEVKGEEHLLTI